MAFKVFVLVLLIVIANGAQNWFCNATDWSKVSGQWAINSCTIVGADQTQGAVIWIGDRYPASKSWTNYNITLTMQLLDPATNVNNAGLLYRAQTVSGTNNGGKQYYVGFSGDGILGFGKMNNGWDQYYTSPNAVCNTFEDFTLIVEAQGNKYNIYVNNTMVTSYTDNSSPLTSGSIGLRGYGSTALYSNLNIDLL